MSSLVNCKLGLVIGAMDTRKTDRQSTQSSHSQLVLEMYNVV